MRPNAEMSSGQATFDLKAAREACTKLYLPWTYFETDDQIHSQLVETEYGEYGSVICRYQEEICQFLRETRSREIIAGVNKLPAALDEIERQNAYIEQLSKQCQAFIHDEEMYGWIQDHHDLEMIVPCKLLDVAKKWHAAYRKAQNSNLVRKQLCEQKDERIAELKADLEYYKSGFHSERGVHERVAAILGTDDAPWMLAQQAKDHIAELEAEVKTQKEYVLLMHDRINKGAIKGGRIFLRNRKLLTALKKLGNAKRERGKALVEERAAHNFNKTYYKSGGRSWEEICQKEWLKEARQQLRQEKLL